MQIDPLPLDFRKLAHNIKKRSMGPFVPSQYSHTANNHIINISHMQHTHAQHTQSAYRHDRIGEESVIEYGVRVGRSDVRSGLGDRGYDKCVK